MTSKPPYSERSAEWMNRQVVPRRVSLAGYYAGFALGVAVALVLGSAPLFAIFPIGFLTGLLGRWVAGVAHDRLGGAFPDSG